MAIVRCRYSDRFLDYETKHVILRDNPHRDENGMSIEQLGISGTCEECIRKKEGPPYFYKNDIKLGWMLEDIVHLNNVGAIRITSDNELIQLLYKSYNKTN